MKVVLISGCRPLRGLFLSLLFYPGVPLRFTPGFMLTPASQVRNQRQTGLGYRTRAVR